MSIICSFIVCQRSFFIIFFFFFQAEDGIRDVAVTGVQTCALPIFSSVWRSVSYERLTRTQSDSGFFFVSHPVTSRRNPSRLDLNAPKGDVKSPDRKSVV